LVAFWIAATDAGRNSPLDVVNLSADKRHRADSAGLTWNGFVSARDTRKRCDALRDAAGAPISWTIPALLGVRG
jgi:hypothetical protein